MKRIDLNREVDGTIADSRRSCPMLQTAQGWGGVVSLGLQSSTNITGFRPRGVVVVAIRNGKSGPKWGGEHVALSQLRERQRVASYLIIKCLLWLDFSIMREWHWFNYWYISLVRFWSTHSLTIDFFQLSIVKRFDWQQFSVKFAHYMLPAIKLSLFFLLSTFQSFYLPLKTFLQAQTENEKKGKKFKAMIVSENCLTILKPQTLNILYLSRSFSGHVYPTWKHSRLESGFMKEC